MNSRHAEIILKIMQMLEGFDEIPSVHGSFEDSEGRERLHCEFHIRLEIDAKKPEKHKG